MGQTQSPFLGRGVLSCGLGWDSGASPPIQLVPSLLHLLVTRHLEKLSPCFIWQNLGTTIGQGSIGQETKAHRKMPHDSCQPPAPCQSQQAGQTAVPAFGFGRGSTFRMWKPHNGSYVPFGVRSSQGNSRPIMWILKGFSPPGLEGSWSVCSKGVRLWGALKKNVCACQNRTSLRAWTRRPACLPARSRLRLLGRERNPAERAVGHRSARPSSQTPASLAFSYQCSLTPSGGGGAGEAVRDECFLITEK